MVRLERCGCWSSSTAADCGLQGILAYSWRVLADAEGAGDSGERLTLVTATSGDTLPSTPLPARPDRPDRPAPAGPGLISSGGE
jgi:hypothetical protein